MGPEFLIINAFADILFSYLLISLTLDMYRCTTFIHKDEYVSCERSNPP
jgi:hypothetical protein